ncbi:MAG: AtaL-like protein [Pseudomonadota bacterium]
MPFVAYKTAVDAPADRLWSMMVEKIRRPDRYVPGVVSVRVVSEFGPASIEREMVVEASEGRKTVRELISADETTRTVIFKLKDDPVFTGYVVNMLFEENGMVQLDYTMHWTTKSGQPEPDGPDFAAAIEGAVRQAKRMAEDRS